MSTSAYATSTATTRTTAATGFSPEDAGKLLLRVSLAVLVLLHGISKLINGPGFVLKMVASAGLPEFVAYGVYIGEVLAPIAIILGLFTRPAAAIVAFNMVMAFALVHMADFVALNKQGGWALELQGLYLFGAVTVALLGAGRYSLGGANGRFN